MIFAELAAVPNPGRNELIRFVSLVEEFLGIVVEDTETFGFLWRGDARFHDLARATYSDYVRPSAEHLRQQIPEIRQFQIDVHGLEGPPLRFKFAVLGAISDRWDQFRSGFSVEKWLQKIIDAIDAVLDSLIDAAGGIGSLIKEFKDALSALIDDEE